MAFRATDLGFPDPPQPAVYRPPALLAVIPGPVISLWGATRIARKGRRWRHRPMMKRLIASAMLVLFTVGPAFTADIVNRDAQRQTFTVMEAGRVSERTLDPGEHADVCQNGCIITFPDGGVA